MNTAINKKNNLNEKWFERQSSLLSKAGERIKMH